MYCVSWPRLHYARSARLRSDRGPFRSSPRLHLSHYPMGATVDGEVLNPHLWAIAHVMRQRNGLKSPLKRDGLATTQSTETPTHKVSHIEMISHIQVFRMLPDHYHLPYHNQESGGEGLLYRALLSTYLIVQRRNLYSLPFIAQSLAPMRRQGVLIVIARPANPCLARYRGLPG